MRKSKLLLVLAALLVIIFGGYYVLNRDDSTNGGKTESVSDACQLLTQGVALQILGNAAQQIQPGDSNEYTEDVDFTQCVYASGAGNNRKIALLALRVGKTETGRETIRTGFESLRGPANQVIANLGDDAYFDTDLGQANALVNGGTYWLSARVDGEGASSAEALLRTAVDNL